MDGRLLRSAAARGDDSEIRLLLGKGAQDSINLADEDGKTPLHLALEAKRESRRLFDFSNRDDNMHLAAIAGHSTIQLLLGQGAQDSINLPDKDGKTPLHLALETKDDSIVQLLLEQGAQESINLPDKDGNTPLHLAATTRHSIVQLLLEKGAKRSINLANGHGSTPLHLAATGWFESVVQLLLENGAQDLIDLPDKDGNTPLHLALKARKYSTVQLLLEKGVQGSISLADRHGSTPLHLAATAGHSIVQLLLEKGAKESTNLADKDGKTPLHLAIIGHQDSTVQLLLEKGAQESINLPDKDGNTPLHLAIEASSYSTVQLLLEKGVQGSINLANGRGRTPLHLAIMGHQDSTVQSLLEKGAQDSINLPDENGRTPLHLAATHWSGSATQLLLDRGAQQSINSVDKNGRTPLHLAATHSSSSITQLLLDWGAQRSIDLVNENGKTPLHLAAAAGHDPTVQLLLGQGAQKSINLADENGKTPLHLAAEAGHDAVVRLLLAQNAIDLNLKDSNDQTPLWLAAGMGHLVVVLLLLDQDLVDPDSKDDDAARVVFAKSALSKCLDGVDRSPYSWLSDLRQLGLEKAEIIDLVVGAIADNRGPWISANISNVPDPEATIDTTLHQSCCAHKRRNTRTGDYEEKNKTVSFDRFSEYISREDMQRRVSLFCGLAGVLPPGSGPLSDFGSISFLDEGESIKVIYSDHWIEPQPRNEFWRLAARLRAEAKETTTTVQSTPPHARLISQLQRALRGVINAAITLQQTGFCCDQFTVLTAPESTLAPDNVTTVHMNTIKFDDMLELARDMDQLHYEGLDDSAPFRSVSTRLIGIMETLFKTPLPLPSTIAHQLHLCSLTVQLLCLGIVFYAQAHAGKLDPSYLAKPLTKVEILGSSHDQPYIIAEQAKLACMGELVGNQVFVFRMSTRTWPIGVDGSFLSATCEEIVDSWGPAPLIMDPQDPSERIFGLVIRGGIIQSNGKSHDGVRLFHWTIDFGGKEPSSSDAFGYKEKIVVGATIPAPSSHLVAKEEIRACQNRNDHSPTGERAAALDANRSRAAAQQSPETHHPPPQAQHAVQTPVTNTKCDRDISKSYIASRAFHLYELGSKPSRWRLATLTANLQGGYQVLAQVGGEWQKQSAVPMKRVFLDRWGLERKLSDFESPLGLQISLCTGVARRVPLRVLVREDLMDYVDSLYVEGWEDLKEAAKDAMESKERFAEWSHALTNEQRKCVQDVFWHVLNRLKDTGFDEDGDQFSMLWPYKSDANRCAKVRPRHGLEWLTMLEDKEWSATFAVATNLCLVTTRHPCRGKRQAPWPGVKTLSTSMWLLQPPSDRNHSVVERQIENERWYWNGEKNSRTWFSAQKSNGAIAELEFKNSLKNFVARQITEDFLSRISQSVWERVRSRGVLVEANDAHHVGENVFVIGESNK